MVVFRCIRWCPESDAEPDEFLVKAKTAEDAKNRLLAHGFVFPRSEPQELQCVLFGESLTEGIYMSGGVTHHFVIPAMVFIDERPMLSGPEWELAMEALGHDVTTHLYENNPCSRCVQLQQAPPVVF